MSSELPQHAGDVAAVPPEELARIGGLQVADAVRNEIVETHAREGLVKSAELGQSGNVDEVEAVAGGGGDHLRARRDDLTPPHRIVSREEVDAADRAVLPLDLVSALFQGGNPECIVAALSGSLERELETDPEMGRVASRAEADLFDAPAIAEGVIQRRPEGLGDKPKRIQEVALPRAVGTDEESERTELDVAGERCCGSFPG